MQTNKFAFGLAFAAAALTTVVLLALFGSADVAIVVAVAAGLVGMYALRHSARARLIYRGRLWADDPSESESRSEQRAADERTRPNRTGAMTGLFQPLEPPLPSTRHPWRRAPWTW